LHPRLICAIFTCSKTILSQFLKGQSRDKGWSRVEGALSSWLDGRESVTQEKDVERMKEMIQAEDSPERAQQLNQK
jgi:hypothetical protein